MMPFQTYLPTWLISPFGFTAFVGAGAIFVAAIIALKGVALWNAAKRAETAWFVVLLLVNSVGILEIVYLWRAGVIGPKKKRG